MAEIKDFYINDYDYNREILTKCEVSYERCQWLANKRSEGMHINTKEKMNIEVMLLMTVLPLNVE